MDRFELTDVQAQAIVDMRLRALTGLEREKLENELKELLIKIAELKAILADENKLLTVIKDELTIISTKYGDDRRTSIGYDEDEITMEDLIPDDSTVIARTNLGYIKRMSLENFKNQHRGGKGIKGMQTLEEDYIEDLFMTTNHKYLLFFTNKGRCYRMKAYAIPEASRTARGTAIINLLQLQPEEKITAVIPIEEYNDNEYLFMATKYGIIKKTKVTDFSNIRKIGINAINLQDDDELIEVKLTDDNKEIFMVTKYGKCIRFSEKEVRNTGRTSMGVKGITLEGDDEVVGMQLDTQGDSLLIVSEKGMGKRTLIEEFTSHHRGGKGVSCYNINEKTGNVIGVKSVNNEREIMLITTEGVIIRMKVSDIKVIGRHTSGVKLINLKDDVLVATVAKVRTEDTEIEEEENSIEE